MYDDAHEGFTRAQLRPISIFSFVPFLKILNIFTIHQAVKAVVYDGRRRAKREDDKSRASHDRARTRNPTAV